MPPRGVKKGSKRARQYEQVKESAKKAQRGQELNIEGRSSMNKQQLERAVDRKKG